MTNYHVVRDALDAFAASDGLLAERAQVLNSLGTLYVVLGASGSVSVDVSADFADGTTLHDAYTGATAEVSGGSATFEADASGVVLIEAE